MKVEPILLLEKLNNVNSWIAKIVHAFAIGIILSHLNIPTLLTFTFILIYFLTKIHSEKWTKSPQFIHLSLTLFIWLCFIGIGYHFADYQDNRHDHSQDIADEAEQRIYHLKSELESNLDDLESRIDDLENK